MHFIMIVIALTFLFISFLLKRREEYLSKNWIPCSGTILKSEEKIDTSTYEAECTVVTTVRYAVENRNFEFNSSASILRGKVGGSVELLYNPNNFRKVALKEVGSIRASVIFVVVSLIPFFIAYKYWQPISLNNLIVLVVGVLVFTSIAYLKLSSNYISVFFQPIAKIIENEPENATEVL